MNAEPRRRVDCEIPHRLEERHRLERGTSASMDAGPQCGLWDPPSVGEENKTFFTRVWKSLPRKRVLKPWGWRRYVTCQSRQYLLAVGLGLGLGLGCYTLGPSRQQLPCHGNFLCRILSSFDWQRIKQMPHMQSMTWIYLLMCAGNCWIVRVWTGYRASNRLLWKSCWPFPKWRSDNFSKSMQAESCTICCTVGTVR